MCMSAWKESLPIPSRNLCRLAWLQVCSHTPSQNDTRPHCTRCGPEAAVLFLYVESNDIVYGHVCGFIHEVRFTVIALQLVCIVCEVCVVCVGGPPAL